MGSAPGHQEWRSTPAETLIVDGETLRLGERLLRLDGLDAPERGHRCTNAEGQLYDCGTAAAAALARMIGERGVACRIQGRDRFGRSLGTCTAGEAELNASLVQAGWALASAPSLAPLEAAARQAQRGLWSGGFEPPAYWRRGN
jgi:endonuclease YncB( thermonuclease family)